MPAHLTEAELAAQAEAEAAAKATADAEVAALAEAEFAAQAEAESAAIEAAAKIEADKAEAAAQAVAADRERVTAIFAATPVGDQFAAYRDRAIKDGSSAASYSAFLEGVKAALVVNRTNAINDDTQANADVKPGGGKADASTEDAAVKAILNAGADVRSAN